MNRRHFLTAGGIGTIMGAPLAMPAQPQSDPPFKMIEIDVSGMVLHDAIFAHQAKLPEGVELLSSPDSQLFSVTIAKEPELEVVEESTSVEVPTVGETEATEE